MGTTVAGLFVPTHWSLGRLRFAPERANPFTWAQTTAHPFSYPFRPAFPVLRVVHCPTVLVQGTTPVGEKRWYYWVPPKSPAILPASIQATGLPQCSPAACTLEPSVFSQHIFSSVFLSMTNLFLSPITHSGSLEPCTYARQVRMQSNSP